MNQVFPAALVGSLIGTFVGGLTKFLWERLLPDWITWRRTLRMERDRHLAAIRAPAYLAFSELQGRLRIIAHKQAKTYKNPKKLGADEFYVRSTAYLLSRAFAWQVVLREHMASYDYAELYKCLQDFTKALTRGKSSGFQIFKLEQHEIGERMLTRISAEDTSCLLFSEFVDRITGQEPQRWIESITKRTIALLENPYEELDRLQKIDEALTQILKLIDPDDRFQYPSKFLPEPIDANKIRTRLERLSRVS
jgi:hypothetical protein